ncbi:MAG: class I SAM-dependent methyltransferase [Bacteroides sp.]|nr:class I SAM-dependent methyltransferase [Prevotella sp.]MCM1408844.1 class I SAM-dependent methyltransferase [Treponema brennaborense]MCM1470796.1 class I SAM-dependent methyltransferase [Bacteroides sp.]
MDDKIKVNLSDTAETMLQSFYARAQYSLSPRHKFYDAKAVEIVRKIDYDFSAAEKDRTMSGGVLARTIVFDELVKDFIAQNPECTVVNIACGLDTRVYRLDNGRLRWYNLDLPEVIELRNRLFGESGRISAIGKSALDSTWANQVETHGKTLFIIEGFSMYLTAAEVGVLLGIIRDHFDSAAVMMECIAPMWTAKQNAEKSIAQTGAKFRWGANSFDELGELGRGFRKIRDDNILRGKAAVHPFCRILGKLPAAKKIAQKILIFERI